MWIGIPYTKYKYYFTVPRKLVFCIIATILYALLSLPETNKLVGSFVDLTKFDDIESHDRYYLLAIHSIVFGLLMFLLISLYNPYKQTINIQKNNIV